MENLEILILPVSQATSSVTKMDNRKIRSNDHELSNTDESGEFLIHSSLNSFRYQLASSSSSKTRQRSKLRFKIKSKNFTVRILNKFLNLTLFNFIQKARKFFRHKVRIVIILLRLVDYAFEKFK